MGGVLPPLRFKVWMTVFGSAFSGPRGSLGPQHCWVRGLLFVLWQRMIFIVSGEGLVVG